MGDDLDYIMKSVTSKRISIPRDLLSQQTQENVTKVITYDKYTPEKLMTLLDKDKLEELEEEFEQHPTGIELINFVWLMKSALNVPKEEEYDLIYGLCRLFSDIDINGDLHMEWTEFTQYIIDTVMKNSTNNDYLQMLKDKNKVDVDMPIDKLTAGQKKMSLLDLSKLCIFKRYYLSTKAKRIVFPDVVKFQTSVFDPKVLLKIPFITQSFIFKLTSSKELYVVGAACDKMARRSKIWYMDRYKCWITAGEDNILRHWNTKSQKVQLSIYYVENKEALKRDPNSALLMLEVPHPDTIMDVIEIYSPHLIVSA